MEMILALYCCVMNHRKVEQPKTTNICYFTQFWEPEIQEWLSWVVLSHKVAVKLSTGIAISWWLNKLMWLLAGLSFSVLYCMLVRGCCPLPHGLFTTWEGDERRERREKDRQRETQGERERERIDHTIKGGDLETIIMGMGKAKWIF